MRLYAEYQRTRDPRLRDRLVLGFAPLVKYIVYRKAKELPSHCEVEDFMSCGLEALIVSIDRYDPSKGTTLEQYAWTRIHGAVLDELRRQDWAPRSVRRWERDMKRIVEEFTALHRRAPRTDELADALGVSIADLRAIRDDIARSEVTSLNMPVLGDEDGGAEKIDLVVADSTRMDPFGEASRTDAKERFREAFAQLPQREREVAVMLYVKNLTLAEIGQVLGVSESRVCQIHGALKKRLRAMLAADEDLFLSLAS